MNKLSFCAAALSSLFYLGCGGDGGSSSAGTPNDPPPPPVITESFRLNLGPFGGSQVADVVFINTGNGGGITAQLDTDNKEAAQPRASEEDEQVGCRDLPPELCAEEERQLCQAIQARSSGVTAEAVQPKFEEIPVGGDFTFFVVGSGNVTCRKVLSENDTVHCSIFAEVRNGQPILDPVRATQFATAWDTNNPVRPGSGIYDQVRGVFGSEWTVNGGRDGDSKVVLVYCSSATLGSGLFGFFRPSDEFTQAEVPNSNEGEILYLNADKPDFDVLATMAHEFQHMVRFNTKLIQQGTFAGQAENDTIDEGCSMVAEELCGYGLQAQGGGNAFMFQATRSYLEQANSFNLFRDFNGSLKFYGGGYLLAKYFRETFGDSVFFRLNTNTGIGYQNMVNLSAVGSTELFRRFSLALLASPFTGAVPAEARYPSGFTTQDTFDIRTLGMVSLPGLEPAQVASPPTAIGSVTILPFSPTLVRFQNGSGNDLIVEGRVDGDVTLQAVFESVLGQVAFTQVETASSGTLAREDDSSSGEATQNLGYTNPVTAPDELPMKVEGGMFVVPR